MRVLIGILLMFFGVHAEIAVAEENAIGIIKIAKGNSFIMRNEERVSCQVGSSVFQNDVLETGDDGSLGVTLKDNTRLSLGPNSRLTLKEFTFEPREEKYSFISEIVRGTLVYLSGIMAKLSPESVTIKTPTTTVGIRGTRLVVRIVDENETDLPEKVPASELP